MRDDHVIEAELKVGLPVQPDDSAWSGTLQGWDADLASPDDRARAIDLAFDYRGDVTLTLESGERVNGYLFNRERSAGEPFVEMLIAGERDARRIAYRAVVGLRFSGADTAAGKSWEAWLDKVAQAEANGQIAERYPESLEESPDGQAGDGFVAGKAPRAPNR